RTFQRTKINNLKIIIAKNRHCVKSRYVCAKRFVQINLNPLKIFFLMVTSLQSTICQNSYSIFSKPTVRQEVFENTKKSVRLDALLYTELLCLLLRFHLGKAVAAINRTVFTGFERNFRFSAAGSAGRYVHL